MSLYNPWIDSSVGFISENSKNLSVSNFNSNTVYDCNMLLFISPLSLIDIEILDNFVHLFTRLFQKTI